MILLLDKNSARRAGVTMLLEKLHIEPYIQRPTNLACQFGAVQLQQPGLLQFVHAGNNRWVIYYLCHWAQSKSRLEGIIQ